MRGAVRSLLKFSKLKSSSVETPLGLRTLSSSSSITTKTLLSEKEKEPKKPDRDSHILQQFRLRKLKASFKTPKTPLSDSNPKRVEGVLSFNEVGLSEELSEALAHLGFSFPSEIQCVGIPAILDGKNVVLSSHSDSDSVELFTYLLPLIQNLRRDAKLSTEKPKGPRAIVLCTTQELAEECFRLAKFVLEHSKSKSAKGNGRLEEDASDISIGMLISTPDEVIQFIEEGDVVPTEIKYLVFDEVDDMFDQGLGPDIQKILSPLKERLSNTNHQGLQTILVTSMMTKVLREDLSSLVENLERSHAGQIAAMLLEIDQTEAFHLLESLEALKQKAVELIHSLNSAS
ncbi:DNA helicase, ATP-dependent [Trema orientale]|uniref:DNA helicase, ATP-dependent n=1 Tax=Trema orientale TaxID=63057 RepID=A0A2P5FES1_TREOI|nr:DNA helicase, ATP-dependent [Trema orientale]